LHARTEEPVLDAYTAAVIRRWCAFLLIPIFTWIILAPPAAADDPTNLIVSNLRDTSFVIAWTTTARAIGQVQLIGGAKYSDDRGATFSGTTHYVTVGGLQPDTRYQFDVLSGNTTSARNGSHYSVTTGARLDPPIPDLIVGQVRNPDNSIAADTIVLVTVQQPHGIASPLSMLLTPRDNGIFHVNLSDARTATDPTRYLYYAQDDQVTIQAINAFGVGMWVSKISDSRLRANDPAHMAIVQLRASAPAPTLIAQPVTPTPVPETAKPFDAWNVVLIGIAIAILIAVGLVAAAALFVWKR
jgi:hypothetical protein